MPLSPGLPLTFAAFVLTTAPAGAEWVYSVAEDASGLEYAKASVSEPTSGAALYTECTEALGLGLALILPASQSLIDNVGGQTGQILYMTETGDTSLATVDYAPGEGVLTLTTADAETIEAAWTLFGAARETVAVRFTFPPFPQVYELVFPAGGVADALARLDGYCQ